MRADGRWGAKRAVENRPWVVREKMIGTDANWFEIKVHYMVAVVFESDIGNDEEEMQEMYPLVDERQSTIRQSGGGDYAGMPPCEMATWIKTRIVRLT